MSRAEFLSKSAEAANYMQSYIRARKENFQETAIETNPSKGWGTSEEVRNAHDIAMMLWHYTDEHFLNCQIPRDYASPKALTEQLDIFFLLLTDAKNQLEQASEERSPDVPMTISIVHEKVVSCLYAVEETLAQLKEAQKILTMGDSERPVAVISARTNGDCISMEQVQNIADRFNHVVRIMNKRRKPDDPLTIKNEYDVQYLFQGLLAVSFEDIRPEEPTPSAGGGSGRADTLLKSEQIVVEYKCMRNGLDSRELRKQIADDFILYGGQEDCKRLFVFVYDADRKITNPTGFEKDLTREVDGIEEVRIVISQ